MSAGKWQSAFQAANKQANDALKKSRGFAVGKYAAKLEGVEPDEEGYTNQSGDNYPLAWLRFRVVGAQDNHSVGKPINYRVRCGPVFEDGSSPELSTVDKMLKKWHRLNNQPAATPDDTALLMEAVEQELVGTVWEIDVSEKDSYTNYKILNPVV